MTQPDLTQNNSQPVKSILKRTICQNKVISDDLKDNCNPILHPILPYHKKWENYIAKRNAIFNLSSLTIQPKSRPKRSTVRLRRYWRLRKICKKSLVSAIISNPKDLRYYAKIEFLNFSEFGLLDTGANISCIGSDLASFDFIQFPNFTKCKSFVNTADGRPQVVKGWLDVDVRFKNKTSSMKIFIIPSISQRVILGVDFCRAFGILTDIIGSVDMFTFDGSNKYAPFLSELQGKSDVAPNCDNTNNTEEETFYPLFTSQRQQLDTVIGLFPNFEKQGLGRTSLIKHSIDVGNANPIKQRFYPVSPAVEKVIFKEIDRMLSLGVIEPSNSAWSSPMRLVLKPNKVRLCLDARKVNLVTKKDAYPLPSIEGIFARLPKAHLISKLDLKDAYWQIALDDASKPLTAFTIPGRPLYQFTVMPFGLCNAPQTMCRLMDEIIPSDLRHSVFGYLDDLVIVSEDFETHLEVLVRIASQFRKSQSYPQRFKK